MDKFYKPEEELYPIKKLMICYHVILPTLLSASSGKFIFAFFKQFQSFILFLYQY